MTEKIKIIGVPPGQAPEKIRKQWVGLVLPVEENAPGPEEGIQIGIRGGQPENLGGYPVRTQDAIELLKEKSPQTAKWWERNFPPSVIPRLVFSKTVCEIIPEAPAKKP